MSWSAVLQVLTVASPLATVGGLWSVRATNKKINAEARNLDNQNVTVWSDATTVLLEPLERRLGKANDEVDQLTAKVDELTVTVRTLRSDLDAAHAVATEETRRRTTAEHSAAWYRREFERISAELATSHQPPAPPNPPRGQP